MTLDLLKQIIKEKIDILTNAVKAHEDDEVDVACDFAVRKLNQVLEEYEKRKSIAICICEQFHATFDNTSCLCECHRSKK